MTTISLSKRTSASPDAAYRIVVDVEQFPDFMDNVMRVEVLLAENDRKVVVWEALIDDVLLEWTEEGVYFNDLKRLEFRAIEGAFERFDGFWQVHDDEAGSRVEVSLDYEIGLPEIEDIIGPLLRERLIQNFEGMLTCLARRAEQA